MFWLCFDSQTQFRGAVIYVSLPLANDGILSEASRLWEKNISLMTEVGLKWLFLWKNSTFICPLWGGDNRTWWCCVKGRCTDITAPITDQKRRKGRPVRLHRAYRTWLRQEPQCQTKVMTFRFLRRRPVMLCQQLVTQRRRQTLLQHSDLNSLNWIIAKENWACVENHSLVFLTQKLKSVEFPGLRQILD